MLLGTRRRIVMLRTRRGLVVRGRRGLVMLRTRRRLVMVMLRRRRWRRNYPNHAGGIAIRTRFRSPTEKTARHFTASFAARTPCPACRRPSPGRQRRNAAEGVYRAERQRSSHKNSECASVEFHLISFRLPVVYHTCRRTSISTRPRSRTSDDSWSRRCPTPSTSPTA